MERVLSPLNPIGGRQLALSRQTEQLLPTTRLSLSLAVHFEIPNATDLSAIICILERSGIVEWAASVRVRQCSYLEFPICDLEKSSFYTSLAFWFCTCA